MAWNNSILPLGHTRVAQARYLWHFEPESNAAERCGTARLVRFFGLHVRSKLMMCESWKHEACMLVKSEDIYGRARGLFTPVMWHCSVPHSKRVAGRMGSRRSELRKRGVVAEALMVRRTSIDGRRCLEVFASANLAQGKVRTPPMTMTPLTRDDALIVLAETLIRPGVADHDWTEGWRRSKPPRAIGGEVHYIKSPTIRRIAWDFFCRFVEMRVGIRPTGDLEREGTLPQGLSDQEYQVLFAAALKAAFAVHQAKAAS